MSVKISQLSSSTPLTSDDFFPVVDSGSLTTKRASAEQILNYVTSSTFNSLTVTVLTGSSISGSLARFTSITGSHAGSGAGLTSIPNSALVNSSVTVGSTIISLGDSATTIQGISVLTGSTITGSTALFDNLTSSVALFNGDIRVLGTASITQLNTIGQQSLLIGDKYITILSGGVDHTGINGAGFLWGTSSGPGETTGALGEHAHVLYDASRDALEIFPGLYVTGSTTLFEVSGTTAQFTQITASVISASSFVGVPLTTPGGTNQAIQFNSGSTFSGSTNLIYNYTTNTLSGTTAQFTTISSSQTNISGNLVLEGAANLSAYPDYAYIIYTASFDKLVVSPGLYVSGNLTGSGLGAFQTVSASTYLGLPTSSGGTPGGTNQTVQFNSGSTFSGSSNFVWDYTNNRLGIGTSTPNAQLHANGKNTSNTTSGQVFGDDIAMQTVANRARVMLGNTSGNSELLLAQDTTHGLLFNWTYNSTPANAYGVLETYGGNNPLILQSFGGNVGIATTSPNYTLSVTGTLGVSSATTLSTVSGTTAQFTTISASNLQVTGEANFSGNVLIYGTASFSQNPTAAYIIYSGSSFDKLVAYPGLYVSGNLTGSGHAKFNEVSGTIAEFTELTGSMYFSASNPSYWTSTAPQNIQDAINRIAAAIYNGITGSIA